jgi:hypothetical protein
MGNQVPSQSQIQPNTRRRTSHNGGDKRPGLDPEAAEFRPKRRAAEVARQGIQAVLHLTRKSKH